MAVAKATRPAPPEVEQLLAPYPEEVQLIVHLLRARVLKLMPNAHETVWDAVNAVPLGFSPTTRWQDGIVHIATYSKHVNLGFNEGATLDDPLGILEGTGAHVRHVSFHTPADTKAKWIDDYVRRAMAAAGMTAKDGDSGTTIRVMKGAKRRPTTT
ncbi:MAG TPA: DUF1801 domain-containing protein [Acidimicrobiales bacterium]|nr:DUF1801 domain-containing protein [Acidimicrobiales bacterium]